MMFKTAMRGFNKRKEAIAKKTEEAEAEGA